MVPARIVQKSKSLKCSDMEYGTNNPSMHHSGDGNSTREFHGWGKASNKSDHETRGQQCRYSNTKRESDELNKPATLDDVDPWELLSRNANANAKSETGGWGTWGSADCQGRADESIREIRDPNVKRSKSERGNAVRQISPDPWKQHAGDRSAKNGTDARDKDKKSNRELGKHHSRDCIDDRVALASGWGSAAGESGKDTWKHHNSYDNSKRHSDGLGNAHDRTARSARKQPCGDGTFKREAGGRDNAKRGTDEWGKAPDMNDLDSSDQQGGKGSFKRQTDGWEKASDRSDPDASKRHIRERNVKERETDIWDKAQDITPLDSLKHHGAKGIVKRVTDGWGEALDRREPDSSRQHIEDGKEETGGWCSKVSEDGLDTWERLSKDAAMEKKTVGWGTRDTGRGQSAADAWNHQSRDDNGKLETDGWGKPYDQLSCDPWKRRNDAKRGTDEWGKAPDMNDLDSSDQHGGKGNFKRETDGWEKASDRSDPDASRRHIRERNVKERETDIWDKAQDINFLDSSKHHGTKGNIKRVTDGWGQAPDRREPDSSRQHIEDGKEETGGRCSKVSEDGLDAWERASKDAAMEKKTVGWGTWDTGRGQSAPDAWNHQSSRDDNGKLETDGWGKPTDQLSRDPWKRRNDAKRETDGRGKSPDPSSRDKLKRHNNSASPESGSNRHRSWCPPAGSKRGRDGRLGAGGSVEVCNNFAAGRCRWGSQCKYLHEDHCLRRLDRDISEVGGRTYEKEKNSVNENKDLKILWDQKDGHKDQSDAKDGKELHGRRDGSGRSEGGGFVDSCKTFAAGQCRFDRDISEVKGRRYGKEKASVNGNRDIKILWDQKDGHRNPSDGKNVQELRGQRDGNEAGGFVEACESFAAGRCRFDSDISEVKRLLYDKEKDSVNENKDFNILWNQKDGHRDQSDGKDGQELRGPRDGSGRSEAGGFVEACRSFAAGQRIRGSQCKHLHEEHCPGCFDTGISEVRGQLNEKERNSTTENKNLTILWDQKDGHGYQNVGEDGQELHGVKRSPTCEFLKCRCNRGPECKVAHPVANDGGQCAKDEAREGTLAKPSNCPSSVPQVTSDSASNSAHSICGDGSRAVATAQLLEVKDFTQEAICRRAESCASTIQHNSQIGTARLMLDVESVNIKSSKKNCDTKDDVLKQAELNRRAGSIKADGARSVRSKNEQVPQPVNVSVAADEQKDDIVIRKFKFALADYVKNIIKPAWKEGRMSKEVHNLVVKKAVDKVISVLPAPNIPQTPEQIQHYLSFSETKLKSLVQGYLEKIVSAEPKRGKT